MYICMFNSQIALTEVFCKLLSRNILQHLGVVVDEAEWLEARNPIMEILRGRKKNALVYSDVSQGTDKQERQPEGI